MRLYLSQYIDSELKCNMLICSWNLKKPYVKVLYRSLKYITIFFCTSNLTMLLFQKQGERTFHGTAVTTPFINVPNVRCFLHTVSNHSTLLEYIGVFAIYLSSLLFLIFDIGRTLFSTIRTSYWNVIKSDIPKSIVVIF